MNRNTWNPIDELQELWIKYNRLFDNSPDFGRASLPVQKSLGVEAMAKWAPAVDLLEQADSYLFKVELPAVDQDNVQVFVDNGVLKVEGERKAEQKREDTKYHRVERFHGRFARSFVLPGDADDDNVVASFKDGLLTIEVKKSNQGNKRAIAIENLN